MNKQQSLTPRMIAIIQNKETEYPFSAEDEPIPTSGTYLCRQCGYALFKGATQFHSGCGWPSFDEEISDHVKRLPDLDDQRTEILCARCEGHLGHVFSGENFTIKNVRHCVNSLSIDFVADSEVEDSEEAIFAGGCFWGIEYLLQKLAGVLKTEVGYSGGHQLNPTYDQVCSGQTGHYEAVRVVYDPKKISYQQLTKFFFEIHDPTQVNGQGPDLGSQYLSVIFYYNDIQKNIAELLIKQLENNGFKITTKLLSVTTFWPAEKIHQNYYQKTGHQPYCHFYQQRF